MGFLRILSGEAFFDRVVRGWGLRLVRLSFEVLIKLVFYFLIKLINLPQKHDHLHIKPPHPFLKHLNLLLHHLHPIINLLNPFPPNIPHSLPLLLPHQLQLPNNLHCKLTILMMLLQIILSQKHLLTHLN